VNQSSSPVFSKAASIISVLFHPLIVIPLVSSFIVIVSGTNIFEAIKWIVISLSIILLPILLELSVGKLQGRYEDWDVGDRNKRPKLFLITTLSVIFLVTIIFIFEAPKIVRFLVLSGGIALIAASQINRRTKISIHSLVWSGAAAMLVSFGGFSPAIEIMVVLSVVFLAVSRIITKSHTPAQVILGVSLGLLSTVISYLLVFG